MNVKILGSVDVFGVAIMQVSARQNHAAIVYKDRSLNYVSILHLASHYDLRNEPLNKKYFTVPCRSFDKDELEYFAEHAAKIFEKNGLASIPYGLSYSGAAVFNGDARFIDKAGAGLTCATFILGFFENLGYELIDIQSWQRRQDDVDWQKFIFDQLAPHLNDAQVDEMAGMIGSAYRFRPEEVVSCAGSFDDQAIEFHDAVVLGENLMAEVRS